MRALSTVNSKSIFVFDLNTVECRRVSTSPFILSAVEKIQPLYVVEATPTNMIAVPFTFTALLLLKALFLLQRY